MVFHLLYVTLLINHVTISCLKINVKIQNKKPEFIFRYILKLCIFVIITDIHLKITVLLTELIPEKNRRTSGT